MEELIRILQDKHDAFIGSRKDQVAYANADGFKEGLAWAIDTAKTIIEQEQIEEELDEQQLKIACDENHYLE